MTKFSVDYDSLDQHLNRKKVFKLKDVQEHITKVAFDVVRFRDGDHTIDNLWKIESTAEGDIIVAMYDKEKDAETLQVTASVNVENLSNWNAIPDKTSSSMTIFYKNDPIKKLATKELNIENNEIHSFCKHLSQKLANDKNLVRSLLKSIDQEETKFLLNKYPELNG